MGKYFRIYELGQKEVINLSNGARLGYVRDVEIDAETGHVRSMVIPGKLRFFGLLGRDEDIVVEWASIERLGEDIIFIKKEDLPRLPPARKKDAGIF